MANTDWETATHCPKCGVPGREVSRQPAARRSTVHVFGCENDRCKWFNTTWIVQVKADGTIPVRKPGLAEYPELTGDQQATARRVLEDLSFETTGKEPTA